ncbi:hypothetical protein JCM3765_007782 [Sporobolomyces pararoseus]
METQYFKLVPRPAKPLTSPGNCVVCGKSTMLRCGDCAKYGIGYMFFCGIEHKRLIYSVHRRVCGIRANPFQWPGLSLQEFAALEKGKRILEALGEKVEKEEAWEIVTALKEPSKGERMAEDLGETLVAIRYTAFGERLRDFRQDHPDASDAYVIQTTTAENPIDAAIHLEEKAIPGLAVPPVPMIPWWTEFQHKVLVKLAVFYSPPDQDHENLAAPGNYVEKELRRFCRDVISGTHPREAAVLLKTVAKHSTENRAEK